jgi:hypothetical protein
MYVHVSKYTHLMHLMIICSHAVDGGRKGGREGERERERERERENMSMNNQCEVI